MCGIVAVISAWTNGFTRNEANLFRDMLYFDTLRGWDSTGVFGVDRLGNLDLLKGAVSGPEFIQTKDFDDFLTKMVKDGRFAVGHNRAATRGVVKDENAHPFVVDDNIVLVQNGSYKGDHKHLKDTEVDTEALAHVIAEEPDIAKALQKVDASYALMWYEVKNKMLRIIRNKERPLFTARTKSGGMLFASEPMTIIHAAMRQSVELKEKPYEVEEHNLVTMQFPEYKTWELTNEKIDATYRWQNRGTSHSSGRKFPETDYSGYACAYGGMDETVGNDDYYPPQRQTPINRSPKAITVSISEALIARKDAFYEAGRVATLETMFKHGTQVILEPVDYIHANDHRECKVFHILAKPITPEPMEDVPYFSWVEEDIDESRALEMVSTPDALYKADVGHSVRRVHEVDGKRMQVFSWMAFHVSPIPILKDVTNDEQPTQ